MQLATDDIMIRHGDLAAPLRPSLRAALHLQRKHGLGRIVAGLDEGNLNIIADIVAAGDVSDSGEAKLIAIMQFRTGIGATIAGFHEPLSNFIAISFGLTDEDHVTDRPKQAGRPFSFEDALVHLFEIATGWLGWTPTDAWAATPGEIIAAQRGLIAKLKAIHGTAETTTDARDLPSPEEVSEGVARLRSVQMAWTA